MQDLRFTPPNIPDDVLTDFLRQTYGVQGRLKRLAGERDQNIWVRPDHGNGYVFKIASPDEDAQLVDFQIKALRHLEDTDPTLPVPRLVPALDGAMETRLPMPDSGADYAVRLLTFLPGIPLSDAPAPGFEAISDIGALLGRVARAFVSFDHPASSHFMPWNILNGLVVSDMLIEQHLPVKLAADCAPVLARLKGHSLPAMQALPSQVVHNDAHSGNLMCDPDNPAAICRLIDFGDMVRAPLVVEASTCLASLLERQPDEAEICMTFLWGFQEHMDFTANQRPLLRDAILARLILTVQLLDYRVVNGLEGGAELAERDLPNAVAGLEAMLGRDGSDLDQALASLPTDGAHR